VIRGVGNPAVSDSFDEALDEGRLGVQQSEPVVLLHEEERMHPDVRVRR
jgi:hypothetical protein